MIGSDEDRGNTVVYRGGMIRPGSRVREGILRRFDSVEAILEHCRAAYRTTDVHTCERDGDFLLVVRSSEGVDFESLIVHFEGEQTHAVMLPRESS